MRSLKLFRILAMAGAIVPGIFVEAAQPAATGQRGQQGSGIAKWNTAGLQQANSMGGGEAAISKDGKFRVFVLMGQSNMTGAARASKLTPPYTEKHNRIRIRANGRWEYFVPTVRFGPGIAMAHQLAETWPDDTIGIIKVASGGTGIRGFEKNWSSERADLTFDGEKGSLYMDLLNAVAEVKRVSNPEFSGFVWKQGADDGTKKVLGEEYYATFKQLVSDPGVPDLPVFMPSCMNDEKLRDVILPHLCDEELRKIRNPTRQPPVKDVDLLAAVIAAQNRAGRELHNVTTIYSGDLPRIGGGNNHINAEGQIMLGKITATAVEEYYKSNE